ncbi:MAG: tetratricopeptide repeat protein [Planctomycetota bacterium]|nr:tetratricopeptide repeat protein [Planctomycetota bacterium]
MWVLLAVSIVAVLEGCVGLDTVDYEHFTSPSEFTLDNKNLSPAQLAKNTQEIELYYREPRTPKKVEASLELAELSISSGNGYASLWRGARACYWLSRNVPDLAQRQRFAHKGAAMGRSAIKYSSERVEPYYYTALNIASFCEITRDKGFVPATSVLRRLLEHAKMAVALDEQFDHAGPQRFLGKFITGTSGYLMYQFGSFDDGLEHLRRAVELSPEFAQNQLFLAEALKDDGDYEGARAAIDRLFRSKIPRDHTVEHERWLREAVQLSAKLPKPAPESSVGIPTLSSAGDGERGN